MQRIAFTMKLHPGQKEEYKKRHDEIWPELVTLLKEAGMYDYSIFLDETTSTLFGFYRLKDKNTVDTLPKQAVMKKWWDYMQDLMETHPDHAPVTHPLTEVFHME